MIAQHVVSPAYEDKGLFQTDVEKLDLLITPRIGDNRRGDWVAGAYLRTGGAEIQVVFAGRRAPMALPLRRALEGKWTDAIAAASAMGHIAPAPQDIRMAVTVEGGWRPIARRQTSQSGRQGKQFIASRWIFERADNVIDMAGECVIASIGDMESASETAAAGYRQADTRNGELKAHI